MRIAIREQLAILVLLLVLLALCIVSVPTWIYVNDFVRTVSRSGLTLAASLKADRITSEINLVQTSCLTISSRILVQESLQQFYLTGQRSWDTAQTDIGSALSVGGTTGLLQARVYSRNTTGGSHEGLFNVTSRQVPEIILPFKTPDGSQVSLSDTEFGYPPTLYPNITYVALGHPNTVRPDTPAFAAEAFPGVEITADTGLLLGPLILNETAALLSISIPLRDINDTFILGYMTIVALATSIVEERDSRDGLGSTGMLLLVGPTTPWNRFNNTLAESNTTYTPNKTAFGDVEVHFVLPPKAPAGHKNRHAEFEYGSGSVGKDFPVKDYPAVFASFVGHNAGPGNASSILKTHNEEGIKVAVGFARTQSPLMNWTVIVEQAYSEAHHPISTVQDILLGTVFGTAGLIILLIVPVAHISVLPIRRLKVATEKSTAPPGYEDFSTESEADDVTPGSGTYSHKSKKGIVTSIVRLIKGRSKRPQLDRESSTRRMFKIPGKVEERKHFIKDELTELTRTFNNMSDELVKQYVSLDEKVAERTRELEESKKAAEAANESKTLFIANISHELKTPLNGILGMCAVSMEETDVTKIKQSLKTLYKSGDLLLHLLEDLLSFSKNQIGHQLSLELKEFRLADIRSQILTIFEKQVREGEIDFSVNFTGSLDGMPVAANPDGLDGETKLPALGPQGTGRLKDMCLWGDQHRILQVIINLVSNSLKFTPPKGKVEVRIKCVGDDDCAVEEESRASSLSRASKSTKRGRSRNRGGSSSSTSGSSAGRGSKYQGGTALSINPLYPRASPHILVRERSPTPPPPGARSLLFEFEVQDSGPGIPEHMQQKVFEPFVQGDLGLSKKFGGTGLGLSICHQLAKLMGGNISLQSAPEAGTTFIMLIPLRYIRDRASSNASSGDNSRAASVDGVESEPPRASMSVTTSAVETTKQSAGMNQQPRLVGLSQPFFAAPSPDSAEQKLAAIDRATSKKSGQAKLRVLVADDNSTNVEVVSRMLKLEDVYDVTIAKDGQEAYDMVKATMQQNQFFDVIFMDVQMPNVDGLQSTRLIRQMGYTSPIVALTAFSEESNVRECMDSGMNEFLSKPIRRPALKQVLKKFATIPEEPEAANVANPQTTTSTTPPQQPQSPSHHDSIDEKAATQVDVTVHESS